MPVQPELVEKDAVVVGAGTAGSGAARALAGAGLSVALLDSRTMDKTGARWCNGVLRWQFERAGVPFPREPELRAAGDPVHMTGPDGTTLRFPDNPIIEVDMRLLTERLQRDARASGAVLFGKCRNLAPVIEDGRLREISVNASAEDGRSGGFRFRAKLFVEASGRSGVLRRHIPALRDSCPDVEAKDLCSASHFVYELKDPEGMRRFLDRHGAQPGEAVNWMGLDGGFSALMIRVEKNLEEVAVLTGSMAEGPWAKGPEIMARVRREHPWIGEPVFGGGALIPLRRTCDRLAAGGVALVGDAACQVFPAHGSGIGYGLIAGRMLADSVTQAKDPGGDEQLWDYQCRFQREFGAVIAAYEAMRRMSSDIGTEGVGEMFASGIFDETMAWPGFVQRLETPPLVSLPAKAAAFARHPALIRLVVPRLLQMVAAPAVYSQYPDYRNRHLLPVWRRISGAVLRE